MMRTILLLVLILTVVGALAWVGYFYFLAAPASVNEVKPREVTQTSTPAEVTLPSDFPVIPIYPAAHLTKATADDPVNGPFRASWTATPSLTTVSSWYSQQFSDLGWTIVKDMEPELGNAQILHGLYELGDTSVYFDLTSTSSGTKIDASVTVKIPEDLDHIPEPAYEE